jgi:hypothetical protein
MEESSDQLMVHIGDPTAYGSLRKIYLSALITQTAKDLEAHHAGKHASQTPHVETIIVFLEIDQ